MSETFRGLVIRAQSRVFTVKTDDEEIPALIPKKLRYDQPAVVDPVAVGDMVAFVMSGDRGVIQSVEPRRNALSRPASGRSGKRQVLATNLDLAVVVLSTREPAWKPATIDRYLVLASAGGVPTAVCINKIDLDPETAHHPDFTAYRDLEVPVFFVSATEGTGFESLTQALANKTAVFLGPSGAGKSSLINRLVPAAELKVGAISERTQKGRHTTTWVEMLPLPQGGRLVDSPGLRVLDLSGIEPEELAAHFPELDSREANCRFQDCRHLSEPGCAVKAAVASGEIAAQRYDSYERIYRSLSEGAG